MLDNIGFDIGFAVLIALIGWVWHFARRRAGIEQPEQEYVVPPGTYTSTTGMDQVPPQLKGVVEQALRAAADGNVDAGEQAAIRAAAIAAGAKGVAFQESTSTTWAPPDDGSVEHLGPPPPAPGAMPPPPAPPAATPPPAAPA